MTKNIPLITKSLLIANIGLYLIKLLMASNNINLEVLLGSYYPESVNFRLWQPLSHMFMHAGPSHILFNMFALYMFGSTVEETLGRKKFLLLYFLAGLGAFVLFNLQTAYEIMGLKASVRQLGYDPALFNSLMKLDFMGGALNARVPNIPDVIALCQYYITPMVGASGAIYGVLVAFGMLYPEARLAIIFFPMPIKAKYLVPGLIILEIVLGLFNFSWNPVAHFAHLGGAAVGFALIYYWKKRARGPGYRA